MYTEDLFATHLVGGRHHHTAIESARAQQRRIEHLGSVGGGQHDDTFGAGEPVHLGEDLIQGLLALVVSAHGTSTGSGPADGIDLIDEDDGGGHGLGLREQITHS